MNTDIPSRDDARDDAPRQEGDSQTRSCRTCSVTFLRSGRQAYCSPACRQKAYRQRSVTAAVKAAPPAPPRRGRREVTIYQCSKCDEVFLGQQWCPDCQRPCHRLGLGGTCPHCDLPVSVDQLVSGTP